MNTREMWEDQVVRLSKQTLGLIQKMEKFEQRITYLEGVVVTLLVALKEGGVIVDADDDEQTSTYDLTEN
jgi:hypothetical protein